MEQKEDMEIIWKRWLFSRAPSYKDPKNDEIPSHVLLC